VLDPLDGTKNFAGVPLFRGHGGGDRAREVVLGAIHDPASGATALAPGRGAWTQGETAPGPICGSRAR
jgi:fructose-1,6-bisphosphatase/inositol monophosphatase family enzyme